MPNYIPPRGPTDAQIMFIGAYPGAQEEAANRTFVGESGQEGSSMMQQAGIYEDECFLTNVLRFHPPNNYEHHYMTPLIGLGKKNKWQYVDGMYLSPVAMQHMAHLEKEISMVSPRVIVAWGNLALWATTRNQGILKWRGSVLKSHLGPKVVPSLHPAFIMHMGRANWACRPTMVQDLRQAKKQAEMERFKEPKYNFLVQPSFMQALNWLNSALIVADNEDEPMHISCDIETRAGQIACIGFARSAFEAICIPIMSIHRQQGYWNSLEEFELIKLMRELLTHPNVRVSGQNYIYDIQYIAKQWGFIHHLWHDTMNMQHVLFPDLPAILKPKSLGFLDAMYCEHPSFWKDEGKEWTIKMDEVQHWTYNCKDAVKTWEIAEEQVKILGDSQPAKLQMALWEPLAKMSLRGVKVDLDERARLDKSLTEYMDSLQARMEFIMGHKFNPSGSSPQGKKFFYDDLQIKKVMHKTKDGWKPTLDDEALDVIAKREPLVIPLCRGIQNWRSAGVYRNTFVRAIVDTDNRMRCSWNLATAKTFRLSSSESSFNTGTNFQNQPNGEQSKLIEKVQELQPITKADLRLALSSMHPQLFEDSYEEAVEKRFLSVDKHGAITCVWAMPNLRRMFIPDPGFTLFDIDLDRADLQVVVWEADDTELKQMLREGHDIHEENGRLIGMTRFAAKQFVHLTNYGGKAKTCAQACSVSVHVAEQAQARWFQAHPGILEWHKRTEANLPVVTNKFGYSINFLGTRDKMLGQALAWTPQGTVANVINYGLVNVENNVPEAQLLMQIHDSLVLQIRNEQVNEVLPRVISEMQIVIPYDDPLIIPVTAKGSTESWGDVKEWKTN